MKILNLDWIDDEYHGRTITNVQLLDDDEILWEYDAYSYQVGHRELRTPENDGEFTEHEANGYDARSFDEALLILKDGGHI